MAAAPLTSYAQEVLDGHRELVAECGTSVRLDGAIAPLPVVLVFPEQGLDALLAGTRATGTLSFNVEATLATTAGLRQESILSLAGSSQRYHVTSAEPDPGSPLLFVSADLLN